MVVTFIIAMTFFGSNILDKAKFSCEKSIWTSPNYFKAGSNISAWNSWNYRAWVTIFIQSFFFFWKLSHLGWYLSWKKEFEEKYRTIYDTLNFYTLHIFFRLFYTKSSIVVLKQRVDRVAVCSQSGGQPPYISIK